MNNPIEIHSPVVEGLSKESLQALLSINQVLSSILDGDELLHKILEIAVETVSAERGFLMLFDDAQSDFTMRVNYNFSGEDADQLAKPSESILHRSLMERKPLLVHDARTDPRFSGSESVIMHQITSAIAAPW